MLLQRAVPALWDKVKKTTQTENKVGYYFTFHASLISFEFLVTKNGVFINKFQVFRTRLYLHITDFQNEAWVRDSARVVRLSSLVFMIQ